MRALKFLVILMAVMIVAGVIFLVYAITTGMHRKNGAQSTAVNTTTNTAIDTASTNTIPLQSGTFPDEHTVTLEDNQTLVSQHVDQGHLILYIRNSLNHNHHWAIIDYRTGQLIRNITLAAPQ